MINFERNLLQQATYWSKTGEDRYGNPIFSAPALIMVRWEDSNELYINMKGQEVASRSKIFAVGGSIALRGYLALGDYHTEVNPLSLSNAYEIQGLKTTPDLRNLKTLSVAFL